MRVALNSRATVKPVALGFLLSDWNLEVLVFVEGGKPENPEKYLRSEERTNNKLSRHITPGPRIESGPHRWEASALPTAPSLLPAWTFSSSRRKQKKA